MPASSSTEMVRFVASFLMDKQAEEIQILDVSRPLAIVDYFVIATVRNTRQAQALARELDQEVKARRGRRKRNQGGLETEDSNWVLLDFDEVVVHLFLPEARTYYGLDSLWADAPRLPLPEAGDVATARPAAEAPTRRSKKLQLFPPQDKS